MKSMILALLVAMLSFNGYAQVKTEKEMKQEIKKMEELIQEYMLKNIMPILTQIII